MMRVAVIHDWLVAFGGAERVLAAILECLPEAEVFTVVDFMADGDRGFLRGRKIHTSFVQRLPFARRRYRSYLPLMPLAVESFDLSGFDLVVSSSFCVAKGVLTGPDQLHVSYVHSPMRYAWDLQHQYLQEANLTRGVRGAVTRLLLQRMRMWDYRTANGVDRFISNSQFIARRVWKTYRRECAVIAPPVDTAYYRPGGRKEDFYVTASRLVPYKRVNLIVDAFARMPHRRLVVVGDGPDFEKIAQRAPANVQMLGHRPQGELRDYMQRAKAFVFAALEDFGIAPVEAQACGTPVIAYGRGGVTETVIDGLTGTFFAEQSVESIVGAIDRFEDGALGRNPAVVRANALRFSAERFKERFGAYIGAEIGLQKRLREQPPPAGEPAPRVVETAYDETAV
jgi:glycosyltransferase involved in cell wall biosynthesis